MSDFKGKTYCNCVSKNVEVLYVISTNLFLTSPSSQKCCEIYIELFLMLAKFDSSSQKYCLFISSDEGKELRTSFC